MSAKKAAPDSKAYYSVGEAAALVGVAISTLHSWEQQFQQLRPIRTFTGRRRYSEHDLEMCKYIKYLLRDKRLPFRHAQKVFDSYYASTQSFRCKTPKTALKLLSEVKERCNDAQTIARIEAVKQWVATQEATQTATQ